jgi:hypothetical protein
MNKNKTNEDKAQHKYIKQKENANNDDMEAYITMYRIKANRLKVCDSFMTLTVADHVKQLKKEKNAA